ncbi:beta-ketoacyl synthase N-terminal-like domain-containing protein [Pseudosporangium ferrugineum]|uniref:Ketoacyl-synthetase-like protein n=1 Tax=Pseudosporangium ferrugineum TaxID=439699 RepID=A0A2T0SEL8_9ACTN|nr:beta-ketoacyl synthase N-terminal-like domain-containing protein [Pseudosporangium ferrugineum]PRY31850.1 ketoacyl-synthetase-like protein [Pseudosporangium ferrugineum]
MADDDAGRVAVVGMAARVPGADDDLDLFWDNIEHGVDSVGHFDREELAAWGVAPELLARANLVPAHGVLPDPFRFDAELFGYSPDESALIDPQQRLLLMCAWAALEHAGQPPVAANGNRTGVYVGTGMNVYLIDKVLKHRAAIADAAGLMLVIGNDKDFAGTRIAYKLNLQGPALTLQTACSTSLVAVHTAVQSLLTYETDMALAGAATVAPPSRRAHLYQQGGIFSPDGRCRTFDAAASGTVPGDGVGVVVLKRLEDARRDGDTIHAVIAGTAINNDGSRKTGFTAPGPAGQAAVIRAALAVAGVEPDSIGVVETHGTGTALGDPVEVAGLREVFDTGTRTRQCALTAVKSNIGHLDTAAGVVGLIKMVLALRHRTVPPVAHFETPNPHLALDRTPFRVPAKAEPWEPVGGVRRAGVSAFGIGGTNAHVVLEEALPQPEPAGPAAPQVLLVSARSSDALDRRLHELAEHAERRPGDRFADAAFTLRAGRTPMPWRAAVVADAAGAGRALRAADTRRQLDERRRSRGVVLAFTGRLRPVDTADPVYRAVLDEVAGRVGGLLGADPHAALRDAAPGSDLDRLATFAAAVALARGVLSRGIQPRAVLGPGAGEIAAACVAGVFTVGDAAEALARGGIPAPVAAPAVPVHPGPVAEALTGLDPAACLAVGPALPAPADGVSPVLLAAADHLGLLEAVAGLWQLGFGGPWEPIHDRGRRRIPLPTYPFATHRHVIKEQ